MKKLDEDQHLPFTGHLEELRTRLIFYAKFFLVFFLGAYAFSDQLFLFFKSPIHINLVFIAPAEAFLVKMKVAFWATIFVSYPFLMYQVWQFISPGLLRNERKYAFFFVIAGSVVFFLGLAFCFYLIIPYGLEFLLGYGGEGVTPMISMGNYLSFTLSMMFVFGLVFELPIIIMILINAGIVTPEELRAKRSYVILGIFVFAAIITPTPDAVTQTMMAVPMIALFEAGIWMSRFTMPRTEAETTD